MFGFYTHLIGNKSEIISSLPNLAIKRSDLTYAPIIGGRLGDLELLNPSGLERSSGSNLGGRPASGCRLRARNPISSS